MVGGLAEAFEEGGGPSRVLGGPLDGGLEGVGLDPSGTGEGGKKAAGLEEGKGESVDVFVGAEAFFELGLVVDEFWGIENDHAEGFAGVAVAPELFANVGAEEDGLDGGRVEAGMDPGVVESGFGAVDSGDGGGAGASAGEGEGSGVGKGVEDVASGGIGGDAAAVDALVEVESGFLGVVEGDVETEVVFANEDGVGAGMG